MPFVLLVQWFYFFQASPYIFVQRVGMGAYVFFPKRRIISEFIYIKITLSVFRIFVLNFHFTSSLYPFDFEGFNILK
jgi:hypothetical protein